MHAERFRVHVFFVLSANIEHYNIYDHFAIYKKNTA